jgi:hypothetical protein
MALLNQLRYTTPAADALQPTYSMTDGNGDTVTFHRRDNSDENCYLAHLPAYVLIQSEYHILLNHLGIFPSKRNKWFCYVMLFYTISLNTACFFVTLFQCS